MQVDDALIDKLSRLAALDFDGTEREEIKADLEKMIGFIDKLKELDTTGRRAGHLEPRRRRRAWPFERSY